MKTNKRYAFTLWSLAAVLVIMIITAGCGSRTDSESDQTTPDSLAAPADSTGQAPEAVTASGQPRLEPMAPGQPDDPSELKRKKNELLAMYPNHRRRIETVFKGVDKIYYFADLGFGESVEVVAPLLMTGGRTTGMSVRQGLTEARTTLAMRAVVDTLNVPRVSGRGYIKLVGLHGDNQFGEKVSIPGLESASGAVEVGWRHGRAYLMVNCCNQAPKIAFSSFGQLGDTLLILITFRANSHRYDIQVIGPASGRGFTGFNYCKYRTVRGYLHPDVAGFPYEIACDNDDAVSLLVGAGGRGSEAASEPVMTVTLF